MLIDDTALAYNKPITDWQLGDDREFTRVVAGLPAADPDCTDAYLTLKASPTVSDAQAIFQLHITTAAEDWGQITGVPATSLLFHVFSSLYQALVNAGTVYYYDIRVITTGGIAWTIESGTVNFQQNVTQANATGTPASLTNNGIPQFQGFGGQAPTSGFFNLGDFIRNSNPAPGTPSGWVCIAGGSPGTWVSDGIVGDD